jgi:hypothetical protein
MQKLHALGSQDTEKNADTTPTSRQQAGANPEARARPKAIQRPLWASQRAAAHRTPAVPLGLRTAEHAPRIAAPTTLGICGINSLSPWSSSAVRQRKIRGGSDAADCGSFPA